MVDRDERERERMVEAIAEGVERARRRDPVRQVAAGIGNAIGCLVALFGMLIFFAWMCG